MNKYFDVKYDLEKYSWVLVNEIKKIGIYNYNEAQIAIPPTKEEFEEYEKELIKSENSKTSFIIPVKPKEKTITVWYTSEIPLSNGPGVYWGLPGLILEVNDRENIILCTKIELTQKIQKIKFPKDKNLISAKAYSKIVEKKLIEIE